MTTPPTERPGMGVRRALTLYLLCLGALMIILDSTIVTIALPSIVADIKIPSGALTWILNAYMLTFGGLLLISGRLGDLYGAKRTFLIGIAGFTLASAFCGIAPTPALLLVGRAVQGIGAAVVMAMTLSLIITLFKTATERAKAMAVYGLVCAAGGGVGDLLGGVLTSALSWRWIFWINFPIGALVAASCAVLVPRDVPSGKPHRLDVGGALAVTGASTLLVYALVSGNESGWAGGGRPWVLLILAVALMVTFLRIEHRARDPMIPLDLFRNRSLMAANLLAVLWASGSFAWFVVAALYLQRVLGYDALRTGLAFLPATVIMAVFSAGLSARLVIRFGVRAPFSLGLGFVAIGLALFARAPQAGVFVVDVLPGMLVLGLGSGIASTPLLLAAMHELGEGQSGLASGLVNTSFMMGGALGLGVLASLADFHTVRLQGAGVEAVSALNSGYHLAFLVGAVIAWVAAVGGWVTLQAGMPADAAGGKAIGVAG